MVNLKGLMMILELHRQGLPISVIAQQTGHDRKTVRKYIRQGLVMPKYKPRAPRPTVIQPRPLRAHCGLAGADRLDCCARSGSWATAAATPR